MLEKSPLLNWQILFLVHCNLFYIPHAEHWYRVRNQTYQVIKLVEYQSVAESCSGNCQDSIRIQERKSVQNVAFGVYSDEQQDDKSSVIAEINQKVVVSFWFVINESDEYKYWHECAVEYIKEIVGPSSHNIGKHSKNGYSQTE